MGIITSETKKAHVIKFDFGKQNIYELRISVKSNRFMGACEEEGTAEIVGVASFGLGVFEELESSSSSSDRFLFPADFLSFEWEEESEVAEWEDSDPASSILVHPIDFFLRGSFGRVTLSLHGSMGYFAFLRKWRRAGEENMVMHTTTF
jgi:hypothetical protein